ncbi:hypothetical protein [Lentzea cavernae]|uniref:Integral membrane protein n=1 Tax=Lentzea cavernae TaxID=2020703 RepID=A0ABQ3MDJ2_9PSEU|nr:hypothetical protein [Lentzea cavernae]GHH40742.1 hypothetical protein GCM10017774_34620 [Lentzea cavernae]
MTPAVVVLLLCAGLSEAVGRVLPFLVRRPGTSPKAVVSLLTTGGLVEASVFALWPLTAWTLADWAAPAPPGPVLVWTPGLLAPLLLAAVLAFPLLGPALHLLLLAGVGVGLTGPLAAATGLGWWSAAACVAVAGAGLGVAVEVVRRLVGRMTAARAREVVV